MICVSLGQARADELLVEHRRLVDAGVPLVEWRLDHLAEPFDLAAMLVQRPGPVIVTVRRPEDGGQWHGSQEEHDRLLREALAAGAEYVDLEEDTAARVPRSGKSQRIVSLHDLHGTPDKLEAIHARLAKLDADVVKLATTATCTHDSFRMLRLILHAPTTTVGMCMGELGLPTRVLAGQCGAPWVYTAPDNREAVAPGQISFRTMLEMYRYPHITRATKIFGVIGDPIGHSLSPAVHNAAFAQLELDMAYLPFRVPPADLENFLFDARQFGIRGLSVTIPHKEAVLADVEDADEYVRAVGAANTLVIERPDRVQATNTDLPAVVACLALGLGQKADAADFRGKTALVLGAGGAAKAVVHALADRGAEVAITSRTQHRADELARHSGGRVIPWDARHDETCDILVNCTPLGMFPEVDATPYEAGGLRAGMVVFDTVYNPEQTRLVREAHQAGATVVTGVEMFVRQAALQFKLFTGHEAPIELMQDVMAQALSGSSGT